MLRDFDVEPFDPTRAPQVDVGRPLGERPTGGLGLHLVRRIARRHPLRLPGPEQHHHRHPEAGALMFEIRPGGDGEPQADRPPRRVRGARAPWPRCQGSIIPGDRRLQPSSTTSRAPGLGVIMETYKRLHGLGLELRLVNRLAAHPATCSATRGCDRVIEIRLAGPSADAPAPAVAFFLQPFPPRLCPYGRRGRGNPGATVPGQGTGRRSGNSSDAHQHVLFNVALRMLQRP